MSFINICERGIQVKASGIDLKDLCSDKPKVKYGCAKKAVEISADDPEALLGEFDTFAALIKGENNILKWNAVKVIGNLSAADDNRVDGMLDEMLAMLTTKSMITAANTISALTEIVINKPYLEDRIIKGMLGVENAVYYNKGEVSPECTDVAIGHVVKSLKRLGKDISSRKDVQQFLKRQAANQRPAVSRLAKKLVLGK